MPSGLRKAFLALTSNYLMLNHICRDVFEFPQYQFNLDGDFGEYDF